jgi:uncharacterized protein (UPF0332 family)
MTKEEIDEFIKIPISEEFFNCTRESLERAKETFDDEDFISLCISCFGNMFNCLGSCLFTYRHKPEDNDVSSEEILQDYFYTEKFIDSILDLMYKKFPELERTEKHEEIDVKEVYENTLEETLDDLLKDINNEIFFCSLGIEEFDSQSLVEITKAFNTFKLFDEYL